MLRRLILQPVALLYIIMSRSEKQVYAVKRSTTKCYHSLDVRLRMNSGSKMIMREDYNVCCHDPTGVSLVSFVEKNSRARSFLTLF